MTPAGHQVTQRKALTRWGGFKTYWAPREVDGFEAGPFPGFQ